MSTVIETLGKYESYLRSKQLKPATLRKVNLSMRYFSEVYGNTDTFALKATDMHTFFQWLKTKKSKKSKKGELKPFGSAHLKKILTHVKAYLKRLSDNAQLGTLVPGDVPSCKVTDKRVSFLSKEEMSLLMLHFEQRVTKANA